ncbi:hypothetical protein protein [Babesia ovis]|uniref:Transcription initiation factor IIF subunit beta n=1 Tax=Babesia ovis TaxID=5869 RepID=A0A9W5T7V9_BABOV|nr:hypothetical protein protein [Babesia ovis]
MGDYSDPNSEITLVKVPKFLAEQWRNCENQSFLGYCKKNKDGIVEEVLARCEGKQQRFLARGNQLSCPTAVQMRPLNASMESMGKFKRCLTVYPTLDMTYKSKIKERHIVSNVQKRMLTYTVVIVSIARGTTHESRSEPINDRSATLFKYYNPHPKGVANIINEVDIATPAKQETPYSRAKTKVQKRDVMDMDELKMSLCKIFETDEGREGLQFKRICQLINQPPANVKMAIDEITEHRKRPTDHKMAYFLRNHFNPEEKKSILTEHLS